MKKYLITILMAIMSLPLFGQTYYGAEFELNSSYDQESDFTFVAGNYITLEPGFFRKSRFAQTYQNTISGYEYKTMNLILDSIGVYPPESGLTISPNENTVVGTLGGTIDVSTLGGLVYSVPIDVPTGINGMQPSLAVTYNSQAGNGLLCWGWDLSGISCITRTGQTLYHDGKMTAADLTSNDRFLLDGQRLINVKGTYGSSFTEYRTENDALMKIEGIWDDAHTNCFKVLDRNGDTIEYGTSRNSRLVATESNTVICWMISSITDHYGNSVRYHYDKDDEAGKIKIQYIDYTINDSQSVKAQFRVEFKYESWREDYEFHYIGNNLLNYQDRLTDISVTSLASRNKIISYHFDYQREINMFDRYLKAIVKHCYDESGHVESSISTTINRHDVNPKEITDSMIEDDSFLDEFPFKGDFNGDGFTDLAMIPYKPIQENDDDNGYQNYPDNPSLKIYLNDRNGGFYHEKTMDICNLDKTLDWVYVLDINGDGLDDVVTYFYDTLSDRGWEKTTIELYLNSGNRFTQMYSYDVEAKGSVLIGDFDGSGTTDLLFFKKEIQYHKKFKTDGGTPFYEDAPYFINAYLMKFSDDGQLHFDRLNSNSLKRPLGYVFDVSASDFDGDGTSEIIFVRLKDDAQSTLCKIDLRDQDEPFKTKYTFCSHDFSYSGHYDPWCYTFPGDFNGDGKSDLMFYKNGEWKVYFSAGTDFEGPVSCDLPLNLYYPSSSSSRYNLFFPSLSIVHPDSNDYICTLAVDDFDGDGCTDVVYINSNVTRNIHFLSHKNKGRGFRKEITATAQYSFRTQYLHTGNFLGRDNVSLLTGLPSSDGTKTSNGHISTLNSISVYNAVESVADNMGNVTSFEYDYIAPSPENTPSPFYTFQYASPDANDICPTPFMQLALRSCTVSGAGNSKAITRYSYQNARLHKKGHGVIGFDRVTTETFRNAIENGWRTRRIVWGEYQSMGNCAMMLPKRENAYVNKNGTAEAISRTEYDFQNVALENITPENVGKVVCPAMITKVEQTYSIDGDDELQKVVKTSYEYDFNHATNTYRNSYSCTKTTQTVLGYENGTARTELESISDSQWSSYTDENHWIINRPDVKTVTVKRDDAMVASKTIYEYDSDDTYAPHDVMVIPNNGDEPNDPLTTQTQYKYDDFGNITSTTVSAPYGIHNERPRIVSYEFGQEYQHRLPTKEYHGDVDDGYITKYTYDFHDQLETVTDCNEKTIEYSTSYNGNLQHTLYFDETEQFDVVLWANDDTPYKPDGARYYTWSKKTGGVTSMTFFHKSGAELRKVSFDFNGTPIFIDKEYDGNGLLYRESAPYAQGSEEIKWTCYKYDHFDRVLSISYPDGSSTDFSYNGLVTTTAHSPSQSNSQVGPQMTQQTLNVLGLVKQNIESYELPENERVKVNYEYNPDGKLLSACIGNDEATKIWLEYDNAGNRTILHDPDYCTETNHLVSVFDAFGQEVSRTTPKQLTSTFVYDKFGRMTDRTEQEENNGNTIDVATHWEYDENFGTKGLLEYITYPDERLSYHYDSFQRLESLTTQYGQNEYVTSYTYDEASRTKTVEYPSKVIVKYMYNITGYLKGYTDMSDHPLYTTNDVNDLGQITKHTIGNSIVSKWQYHPEKHLLSDIQTTVGENNLQNLHYDYDGFNNLASRTDNLRNLNESFRYDNLNRLTDIELNGVQTGMMTYDDYGRMTSKTMDGQLVFQGASFDGPEGKPHAIKSVETNEGVFPADRQDITYTSFDKVKTIVEGDNSLSYTYGYDRQRIGMVETANGIRRSKTYVGNCEYVTETADGVTTEKVLTYLSGPTGVFAVVEKQGEEESLHYILKDHLGSWTTITDAEGNVEQELSFDAWGTLRDPETWTGTSTEAPMFDRGYTGHEHMTAFGLINMNGRCYDPLMSSFLSVDRYVQNPSNSQNFNRYSYCLNNPLKYTDPSGWYYVGGGHSSTSLQGPYECTWTLPERRTIDPSLVMDFLDYWTSFWEGEEFKNGGSGGGVVIKGKDGINTAYSPGMTYKGNDQFTKNAVNSLNEIYSQGGDFGKQMISTLVQSKYTYYITDLADGSSNFKEEDKRGAAYYDQKLEGLDPSQASEWLNKVKIGCGGTIYWNRGQLYRSGEEMILNSTLVLSHELVHAWDACWGVLQDGPTDLSDLNYREWSACYWSNRIAQDMGIPIMTHYAGKNAKYYSDTKTFTGIWYEVVDSYNNPIYKDRYKY